MESHEESVAALLAKLFRVRKADSPLKTYCCTDLSELKRNACRNFRMAEESVDRVVLEEDGTEVDDDDYLMLLPDYTCLVLLKQGQQLGSSYSSQPRFEVQYGREKLFRVRKADSPTKYGFACTDLSELKRKGCSEFELAVSSVDRVVLEEDGTVVDEDEYLMELPNNTCLVLLQQGQHFVAKTEEKIHIQIVQTLENLLTSSQDKRRAAEQLQQSLATTNNRALKEMIANIPASAAHNTEASTREDDPAWFTGVDARFSTKESFMRERAKAKVRGYLNTARDFIKREASQPLQPQLTPITTVFQDFLKQKDFHGNYFDRSQYSRYGTEPMCDRYGMFVCEGAYMCMYNNNGCTEGHLINPYRSWIHRLTFTTWNLYHKIELREVLSKLRYAVENKPHDKEVNTSYFYELLFTRLNLKLVNIARHAITAHTGMECNRRRFYR